MHARFAGEELRLLIVDNFADEAALMIGAIEAAGRRCAWLRVAAPEQFAAALREGAWQAVIYGRVLPAFPVGSALERLRKAGLDLPLIVVDPGISEETAAALLSAGVHDILS